jgi:hypothetical protein
MCIFYCLYRSGSQFSFTYAVYKMYIILGLVIKRDMVQIRVYRIYNPSVMASVQSTDFLFLMYRWPRCIVHTLCSSYTAGLGAEYRLFVPHVPLVSVHRTNISLFEDTKDVKALGSRVVSLYPLIQNLQFTAARKRMKIKDINGS